MEKSEKYWRLIPITIIGIVLSYRLYNSIFEMLLFDNVINIAIGLAGLIILIWTSAKDLIEFKRLRTFSCFLPSMIGLVIIINLGSLNYFKRIKQDSSTLLFAEYEGNYNGFTIDLKKDGSYMISNGSFGGQTNYYGTYAIYDSNIILDKHIIDNVIKTNCLRIRKLVFFTQQDNIQDNDTTFHYYLIQTDKNGNQLKNETIFKLLVDNRKNTE